MWRDGAPSPTLERSAHARRAPGVAHFPPVYMTCLFRFALAALVLPAVAVAQKPQPVSPLERGSDPVQLLSDDGHTYARTGRSAMLVGLNAYVAPGSDEAMARAALLQYTGAVGLRSAGTSDLEVTETFTGQAGTVVRFRQTVGGVPVWGTEVLVNLDTERRVQLIANDYRADVSLVSTTPAISAEAAREAAHAHLAVSEPHQSVETHLIVWPADSGARLAWQVATVTPSLPGMWDVIVDATTGELLRVADRALYHGERGGEEAPTALPTVESHPLFAVVDGSGYIFDPDPITRVGVPYGTPGYVDGNDANTPQLEAARVQRTMRDITQNGTQFLLRSPWASIQDFEAPNRGLFPSTDGNWDFTRDAPGFEAANVFWQVDNYMRYVNVELGVTARPTANGGAGVWFDPHGLNEADNSHYVSNPTGTVQQLAFGEGCVDDSEDADVIIHELGHGLHDFLTTISQVDGLSEGLGDYVAVSYSRSLGLMNPTAPNYNWVFKWDGHNTCWGGRITNYTATYPAGVVPHGRGQHWSTSNLRVWNQLGRERTDKAVFEGIRLTTGSSTQPQAANAVMQAAANMGYTLAEVQAFYTSYQTQGYTGLVMPTIVADEPGAGAESVQLTAPAPNPFNGLTTFELLLDRDQSVTVEVLDALGRRVATLHEGTLRAGARYPFAMEAAGLRAGVYVVRAVGETFVRTQRVTLIR